jgi:hypothetical protein
MFWNYFWSSKNEKTTDVKVDKENEISTNQDIELNDYNVDTNQILLNSINNVLDEENTSFEFINNNDLFVSENKKYFLTITKFLEKYFKKNNDINSFLKKYQLYINNNLKEEDFDKEKFNDIQNLLLSFSGIYESKYYCEKKYMNLLYFIINKNHGLGWRELFKTIIKYLILKKIKLNYKQIINDVCLISRYDVLFAFIATEYEHHVYDILSNIIINDRNNYLIKNYKEITSLAFWIHNEKTKINKIYNFNYNLSFTISKKQPNLYINAFEKNRLQINKSIYLKILRKDFLVPLKNIIKESKNKERKNNNKTDKLKIINNINNNVDNINGYLNYII